MYIAQLSSIFNRDQFYYPKFLVLSSPHSDCSLLPISPSTFSPFFPVPSPHCSQYLLPIASTILICTAMAMRIIIYGGRDLSLFTVYLQIVRRTS